MNDRTEQIETPTEYVRQFPNRAVQVETELAEEILTVAGGLSHVLLRLADQIRGHESALGLLADRVQVLEESQTEEAPAIESRTLSFDDVELPANLATTAPVIERTDKAQAVADLLGVSDSQIGLMCRRGHLPFDDWGVQGRRFNMTEVVMTIRQNPEILGRRANAVLRRIGR